MYRRLRHILVIMAITASTLLLGGAPVSALDLGTDEGFLYAGGNGNDNGDEEEEEEDDDECNGGLLGGLLCGLLDLG